eukprot:CAMPEP_0204274184 /NCGR_PEP_ID=MMETSP0468-20130131/25035_1 /ASSEMBLY_ACC=CAM_ASM_000383 /TAXON_ID=2969 /ORGANISM="Oxyrrhis marina" /LENGTH=627 /DNA_ID=CAMNT_0051250359 /DNA_START=44 /DNA_END=1927 /DNA_ORIENTATION=+
MEVQYRDVSVNIGGKQILHPCSGEIKPGRMTALMGPSGSGKTTLLTCIRQQIAFSGELRFDGCRFAPEHRQMIGFVEQDDIVIPQLTVRQSLTFLAELRFGVGSKEASQRVEKVMSEMRLTKIADTKVGETGASERISGGERKRLCIARELLSDPKLLICDEPTSGLDSTMADSVVGLMRKLCDEGDVSVIASIHQPSSSIFEQFDDLVLLRDGHVVYYGEARQAEALFTGLEIHRNPVQSVSEFLMDLLVLEEGDCNNGRPLLPRQTRDQVIRLMAKQAAALPALPEPKEVQSGMQRYAAPLSRQLSVLSRRGGVLLMHDLFTRLNAVQNIGLMLISALLWFQLGKEEADVYPRWGICMWTCGTWMFFPMFGNIGLFDSVRPVLQKELGVGCYSLLAFYLSRTVLVLPLELVWPTVWTFGLYWMTNLNDSFAVYIVLQLLVYLIFALFSGFGAMISATGLGGSKASTLALLTITYFFAWSGFFVSFDQIPSYLSWARHGNSFMYCVQLAMRTILPDSIEFDCNSMGTAGDLSKVGEGCREVDGRMVLTGKAARERHGIDTSVAVCLGVIVGSLVLVRVLTYILLSRSFKVAVKGAVVSAADPSAKARAAEATAPVTEEADSAQNAV